MRLRDEGGQATVELALCLPLLALVCAGLVEASLLALDQVRVWHGAREAARVAAVEPDPAAARDAAGRSGLEGLDVSVTPASQERAPGRPATVSLAYRYDGRIPIVGAAFEAIVLRAEATTRIERP
ncbi:MAG TPA: TadE/TadG family type IV pilus assembly protein [Actinomycetota bacterium]|nr:TadE/TadG family type IV pilus assembly protein [Actinomycetota bacterium]